MVMVIFSTALAAGILILLGKPDMWMSNNPILENETLAIIDKIIKINDSNKNTLQRKTNLNIDKPNVQNYMDMKELFKDPPLWSENYKKNIGENYVAAYPDTESLETVLANTSEEDIKRCLNRECISTSALLLSNIDEHVDPCKDFYQFACGKYAQHNPLKNKQLYISEPYKMNKLLIKNLISIVEEPIKENDPMHFQKLKSFYKSCVNNDMVHGSSSSKYMKKLVDFLNGWPLWKNEISDEKWITVLFKLNKLGLSTNYLFTLSTVYINSTSYVSIQPGEFILDRKMLEHEDMHKMATAYQNYMMDVAMLLGVKPILDNVEQIQKFEASLAMASNLDKKLDTSNLTEYFNAFTTEELRTVYPGFNWDEYFKVLLNNSLTENTKTIVTEPKYVSIVTMLLQVTPNSIVVDYLIWRSLNNMIPYLQSDVLQLREKYMRALQPNYYKISRSAECIHVLQEKMPLSLGSAYVKEFFYPLDKLAAQQLSKLISKEFEDIVTNSNWAETDKTFALDKIKKIVRRIGYPDEMLDDKLLNQFYDELVVTEDNYLLSSLKVDIFLRNKNLEHMLNQINRLDWTTDVGAALIKAFYDETTNSLNFAASVFQDIFFNINRPKYTNYGSIGSIIGQELMHAVDSVGRHFDAYGNANEWWSEDTKINFENHSNCLLDQLKELTYMSNNQMDEEQIIHIISSDYIGFKTAYMGYMHWQEGREVEPGLPGLNFTNRQLFWLTSAGIWCTNSQDIVAPNKYRVNWPLMNIPEFSNDFNCSFGSKMNPELKCAPL